LQADGRVSIEISEYAFEEVNQALADLAANRIRGRAVLVR
jgi:D-arabinose 1-dehydrogenase-like Zn-dependent alcohol dehydrogenase